MSYFDNPYYYSILEVGKSASREEIIASFRRLAKKHHPDMNPSKSTSQKRNAHERFKLANDAYLTLKDPIKRSEYDTFLNNINWQQVVDVKEYTEEEYSYENLTNKIIIDCPNCEQRLRAVNRLSSRVRVTCSSCNFSFDYPPTYQEWYSAVMDDTHVSQDIGILKAAQKKIRNAWIAGVIYASFILIISLLAFTGKVTYDAVIMTIPLFVFGLSFGIYKRSRTCTIAMFILNVLILLFGSYIIRENILTGTQLIQSIPFVLIAILYFNFEGTRGTFAYHKLTRDRPELLL